MSKKQDHEDLAEKNKDGNTNFPLTEDKTAFNLNSPLSKPRAREKKRDRRDLWQDAFYFIQLVVDAVQVCIYSVELRR